MKRARELVGKDAGLLDLPADAARKIIRQQSYIVDFEPERALSTLPNLLKTSEDRRVTLDVLARLESQIEANPQQIQLLGEIRRVLSPRVGLGAEGWWAHYGSTGRRSSARSSSQAGFRRSRPRQPTHEDKDMSKQPADLTKVAIQSNVLHGKRALVIGIANEHSIAYGCARIFRQLGADLAVTYLNEKARPYVEPLASELGASIFAPCDVARAGELEAVFRQIRETWGSLDIALHSIAFAPKDDLQGRLVESSAEGFTVAMDISCHSFIRMARLAEPLMTRRRNAPRDELSWS